MRICPECGIEVGELRSGELRAHGPRNQRCKGGARPKPKTVDEKAVRYIEEGRVKVVQVMRSSALVEVQGSEDEPYECTFGGIAWSCTCEARVFRCAHVVAASLVTKVSPTKRIGEVSDLDVFFVRGPHAPRDPLDAHA